MLLAIASTASAQGLPAELELDARARSCSPVVDTTGFPGLEHPLFLVAPPQSNANAIYWCTRDGATAKTFLIVVRPPAGCPDEIPYWNPPAGLSLERPLRARLADYRAILSPEKAGPDTVVVTVGIRAEYDGAGGTFVCHEGKWYVHHFH